MTRALQYLVHLSLALAVLGAAAPPARPDDLLSVAHIHNDGFQRVILPSDEMWSVVVLESEDRCGPECGAVLARCDEVVRRSDGAIRMAYVNARETVIGPSGEIGLVSEAFNLTQIPTIMMYMPGPKRMEVALRMDVQTSSAMLASGKSIWNNLRQFHPSLVTAVRPGNIADFMSKTRPELPRMLLLSSKADEPLLLRVLSFGVCARAVTGMASLGDARIAEAFGLTKESPTTLVVSPPGGVTLDAAAPLKPGAFSSWAKFSGNSSTNTLTLANARAWLEEVLPPAPVPILLSQADFDKHCSGATDVNLCFIAILPVSALRDLAAQIARVRQESDETESSTSAGLVLHRVASRAYIKTDWNSLNAGTMRSDRLPVAFMAVDADKQEDFVEAFGAPTPGLVALNPRKKMFALFRGSFQEEHLTDFIMAMLERAAPPLPGLPPRQADIQLEVAKTIPRIVPQANPAPPPAVKKAAPKAKKAASKAKAAQQEKLKEETHDEL